MKRMLWFSAILLAYVVFYWFVFRPHPQPYRSATWTPQEKAMVVERMKFHGIDSCIKDEKGYYFVREGNLCRL
jgi:hypothetical protein